MSNFSGSLDTNVLLRILLNDIPEQKTAALRLVEAQTEQFAVADIALFEIAFVLSGHYHFSREQVNQALQDIISSDRLNCNRALFLNALRLYVNHPALSLEDCALATYAELNDATPLYTFDQKLAKQLPFAKLIAA